MNLLTTESHLNPGIQLADLIVGITTCMCTPQYRHAIPYWDEIKTNLHRNKIGEAIGCGLKIYPKEIISELDQRLFPERMPSIAEPEDYENIEHMRYIYSVVMTEDELNMHFPLP